MESTEETDYDLNLGKYKRFEKKFPWMFLIKILVGGFLVWLVFQMIREVENKRPAPSTQDEIEIILPEN
ncbi:MAG: hypothetical protein IPM74_18865 [Crocinitomicaceae bacterium]|nr:hypothetical protein [Crocinitomicaceae bacterium]MBK8927904.1 hypothetical protein [Crocinitomicaceae bacterium]